MLGQRVYEISGAQRAPASEFWKGRAIVPRKSELVLSIALRGLDKVIVVIVSSNEGAPYDEDDANCCVRRV